MVAKLFLVRNDEKKDRRAWSSRSDSLSVLHTPEALTILNIRTLEDNRRTDIDKNAGDFFESTLRRRKLCYLRF